MRDEGQPEPAGWSDEFIWVTMLLPKVGFMVGDRAI
jgi:hypothetical protein